MPFLVKRRPLIKIADEDTVLSATRVRVRAAPEPIQRDQSEGFSTPERTVRWGRDTFKVKYPEWNPRDLTHNPGCPVCGERIFEADAHTKRDREGAYRGETTVMVDGKAVPIHVDCYHKLKDEKLVLVRVKGMPSPEWVGRWNEYLVSLKLASLGFETFTAVESARHIDILARNAKKTVTFQVRTASWNKETGMFYCTLRVDSGTKWTTMATDVDFVAVVGFRPHANGPCVYVFPSHVLAGKQNLRFTPDGRYAHFRNAWYLVLRGSQSAPKPKGQHIEFILDYNESQIGGFAGTKLIAQSWGDYIEILLHPDKLRHIGQLYEDDRESENPAFFFFLVRELDRAVIHEICHVYHDQILGNAHQDEEDTDHLSKSLVYGEDYRSFIE